MANQITFSQGANSVTVDMPQWNYTSKVHLALVFAEHADYTVGIYDQGSAYDTRYCRCNFLLDASDMANFNAFFSDNTKGRGEEVTMVIGEGFYPFGPDKGDDGTFVVNMIEYKQTGQLLRPWKWYEVECAMSMKTAPSYSLPAQVTDGTFQIGTISGLRPPQESFGSDIEYAYQLTTVHGGTAYVVDKGTNADKYRASMMLTGNQSKMGALVNYLAGTARDNNFTIVSQAGHFPFGKDKGDGTFTVQMLNNDLTISHLHHDRFGLELNLNYVSGPA